MEMIQLVVRQGGAQKRLFFQPPENSSISLAEILNKSTSQRNDLSLAETIPLVIAAADQAGFVLIPH